MNMLGKLACGALVGAVALGVAAAIHHAFFDDDDESEKFSALESEDSDTEISTLEDENAVNA